MALPEAKALSPDELKLGLTFEFEREINEEDVLIFANSSGDFNPLHVNRDYAEGTTYMRRIVHGAFQVGLASSMLGMYLPGREALLVALNARFVNPLYFPGRVRVRGEITSWNRHALSGNLRVLVEEAKAHLPTADIHLGFTFHEKKKVTSTSESPGPAGPHRDRPHKTVLVTGASGEIGGAIVSDLCRDHFVIGAVNRRTLSRQSGDRATVLEVQADLSSCNWEARIREALGDRSLYAVVHAAWPGAPHGGLLGATDEVVEQQLSFGTIQTIRLSRLLFSLSTPEGGRFVTLGSSMGSQKPQISFATYSLGKAAMEHSIRLLAPELARKKITINAVCPHPAAVGMHRHASELQRMKETALVPMGRLCTPEDITGMVRFLLSPDASYLSGQSIALSGAQL